MKNIISVDSYSLKKEYLNKESKVDKKIWAVFRVTSVWNIIIRCHLS